MIRYFCIAALLLFMVGWRYFVADAIDRGGHWAFIAIMAGILAFAFWWEKRFPTQRER